MSRVELSRTAVRLSGHLAGRKAIAPVAQQALRGAKLTARRSPAHLSGSRRPKPGPRLSDQIHLTPVVADIWGVSQRLESNRPYTMSEHEGSRPHKIRGKGKKLKFYWNKTIARSGGRRRIRASEPSYFNEVNHPGNRRPTKFLTGPLAAAAKLNGFHYRSNKAL